MSNEMTPHAVLITQPDVDFEAFIGLSHQMLGYSPAASADASRVEHSNSERYISCLAALRDRNASAGFTPNLLAFVSFGLYVAADERDMLDIMECCAGMPAVVADTLSRNVVAAMIYGTLAQWRDAVKTGSSPTMERNVRAGFNTVRGLFDGLGLNVWKDMNSRQMPDHTYYLEDRR